MHNFKIITNDNDHLNYTNHERSHDHNLRITKSFNIQIESIRGCDNSTRPPECSGWC